MICNPQQARLQILFLPIQVKRITNPPYPKWSNIPYAGLQIRQDA